MAQYKANYWLLNGNVKTFSILLNSIILKNVFDL